MKRSLFLGALAATAVSSPAFAATIEIGPSADLKAEIGKLKAGDELVLQAGTYTLNSRVGISAKGTAAMPITIRSKAGGTAHIVQTANQNVLNVDMTEYIILSGLEISGGSHGIRVDDSDFITIEDCDIHNTGDVGLSANVPNKSYQGLIFRRNHIHDTGGTGEGMYLGCNNGGCTMFDSLIEGNYIHNTDGSSVSQGDGIELKQGSYNNIIRDNVIHNTKYPCIIVYGTAGKPVNLIERNAVWACADNAIQAEADVIIRNNLILGAGGDAIHSRNHQQNQVKDLTIVHNTIVNPGTAVRTQNIAGKVVIANNAIYSQNGNAIQLSGTTTQATVKGNVGSGNVQGTSGGFDGSGNIANDFVDANYTGKRNVYPKAGSKLIGAGDTAYVEKDDYNGTQRGGVADVGAYKFDASGNPKPPVGPGFKDSPGGGGSPGTGGASGTGGSPGTGGATGTGATAGAAGGAGVGPGGATGTGAATGSGGSAAGTGGSAAKDADDDSGCGCRTAASAPATHLAWFGVLGFFAWARRRRR